MRKIAAVVRKAKLKEIDEYQEDLDYWQTKPPAERLAEVTRLVQETLDPGQRMDRTHVVKRRLHE